MVTLHHQIDIATSPQSVWEAVSDSTFAPRWFFGIQSAEVSGDLRTMRLGRGPIVTERIVTLDHAARRFQYSILEGLPIDEHLGTIHVVAAPGGARVLYTTEGAPDSIIESLGRSIEKALPELKRLLEES